MVGGKRLSPSFADQQGFVCSCEGLVVLHARRATKETLAIHCIHKLLVQYDFMSYRDESIKEAGKSETEALGTQISIPDALRFRGVGPEHINSRLAMVSRCVDSHIKG